MVNDNRRKFDNRISVAEARVMELVREGKSNGEIAAALNLSENTVRAHLRSVMQKTGKNNRTGAAMAYLNYGLTIIPLKESDSIDGLLSRYRLEYKQLQGKLEALAKIIESLEQATKALKEAADYHENFGT